VSNHFDIRIQVGRRKARGDPFPVRVRLPDGRKAFGRFDYEPPAREGGWYSHKKYCWRIVY
jgi:hypothetical protein